MDEPLYFYLARLVDSNGDRLASEQIWMQDPKAPESTPERVALDACGFFSTDEHDCDPAGCTVQLIGPFYAGEPSHTFKIEADDRDDAPDFWTATELKDPPAYLATFQGEAWIMDHAMPVDDSRYTFEVTARELMLSDVDLDGLAQAAAAPAEVKEWAGPFTITLEPLPGADPDDDMAESCYAWFRLSWEAPSDD